MEDGMQVAVTAALVAATVGQVNMKRMELTMRLTCGVAGSIRVGFQSILPLVLCPAQDRE